jgi:conjugative relaxase-like TrwC/TraI family protein
MMTISKVAEKNGSVGEYYAEQSEKENYYSQDGQTKGEWHGEGIEALGIKDGQKVKQQDIDNVMNGRGLDGKALVYNANAENRRKGYDIAFTPDKSVSVAYAMAKENGDLETAGKIREMHDAAVKKAMDYLETKALYRETSNGITSDVHSGNLIYASYFHEVNRERESNIHTHNTVANIVKTPDGFKALENKEIVEHQKAAQRIYTAEIAKLSVWAGIAIEPSKYGFRYAGISQELCDKYSQRSVQIKEKVKELKSLYPNMSDVELREKAALATRKPKDLSKPLTATLKKEDMVKYQDFKNTNINRDNYVAAEKTYMTADEAVAAAIKDLTNKEAVISENELLSKSLDYSVGKADIEAVRKAVAENKEIVRLTEKDYTTREMIGLEKDIKEKMKAGINSVKAVTNNDSVGVAVKSYEKKNAIELNDEQVNAVKTMLTTSDRYTIIQGSAGTGKTTLLNVTNQIAKENGYELIAISFQSKAADEMAKSIGSDVRYSTIEGFKNMENIADKHIVVMDEASMTGIRDMKDVQDKIEASGARLVMIGDKKQIQSLGAGKTFEQAQNFGLSKAELKESRRQQDKNYKLIVDDFAGGQTQKSIERIERVNRISEFADDDRKIKAVIQKYNEFKSINKNESVLIVANTNKEKNEYNDIIHGQDKEMGRVKDCRAFIVSENKNLSETELRFAKNYEVGDKIFLKINSHLGRAGSEYSVAKIDVKNNLVELANEKETKTLNLKDEDLAKKIGGITFEKEKEFGVGDSVIFGKNDKKFEVKNGQTGIITNIKDDVMTVKIGEEGKEKIVRNIKLSNYNHVDHAYAVTVNKAQGITVDKVINSLKSDLVTRNNFYVGLSRGKKDFFLATDSIERTRENAGVAQKKTSVMDIKQSNSQSTEQKSDIATALAPKMSFSLKL